MLNTAHPRKKKICTSPARAAFCEAYGHKSRTRSETVARPTCIKLHETLLNMPIFADSATPFVKLPVYEYQPVTEQKRLCRQAFFGGSTPYP
jgi:hypothetical protein